MKTKNVISGIAVVVIVVGAIYTLFIKEDLAAASSGNGNNECIDAYGVCVDEARKLPGSVYDKPGTSPFTRAWAACSAASTACENAKKAAQAATTPVPSSTGNASLLTRAPTNVKIASFKGEVEYRRRGETEFRPLTKDVVLQPGDFIGTGFESSLTLKIGNQKLDVYQMSQLRVDEYLNEGNLQRTQLHLNIGAVQAKVRHNDAIRSDFSVSTPVANASVRGSAMTVSYQENSGAKIFVTEDAADVTSNDGTVQTVRKGFMVTVTPDGRQSAPIKFKKADLKNVKD